MSEIEQTIGSTEFTSSSDSGGSLPQGIEITLFDAQKLQELLKPNGYTEKGIGNISVRHSRRREQRTRLSRQRK